MKALTLRQPWPWAVLAGGCDTITTSTAVTRGYRGPVLVHAGRHLASAAEFAQVLDLAADEMPVIGTPGVVAADAEGFLGVVDITGTHPASACQGICSVWAGASGHHVTVANPRVLPKRIPGFGQSGLFTPAPRVLSMVGGVA